MKTTHAIAACLAVILLWVGCGGDSQEAGAQANLSDVTKEQFDEVDDGAVELGPLG